MTTRPLCAETEDDGTPCPSWAILGYSTCLRHWRAGAAVEGPRRIHTPAYTGVYKEGTYKLDRPVDDDAVKPAAARPYQSIAEFRAANGLPPWSPDDDITQPDPTGTGEEPRIADILDRPVEQAIERRRAAELTPEPENVQTPAENESPREAAPGHRNGCQGCEHEEAEIPRCWSDEDCEAWYRFLAEPPLRTISADEARAALGLPPLSETKPVLLPNPPSRRGWRRLFRRTA